MSIGYIGIAILIIALWQFVCWLIYGLGKQGNGESFFDIVKHNAAIERKWKQDGKPILHTTVGWRPDPYNKQDGYRDNGDGSFSKLIRGGTKEYKKKFRG